MYQNGGTIKKLLDKVAERNLVLPAIQREFVWKPDQICRLFDSLLQGYPIGTFLYWKIKPENRTAYQFYEFVQNYHQRDGSHCPPLIDIPEREFVAVLDGQQRVSSLNIGLSGSYHHKISGKWWSSDDAFPEKNLYLNLLGKPDVEEGTYYQFNFLTLNKATESNDSQLWFLVSRIMNEDLDDLTDELDELIEDKVLLKQARNNIRLLYRTIHDKPLISYYEEENQSLERVLNIFIRMNSGGTPLSYSDLLLSIAVAQWSKLDAREEIHNLVDELNATGDGFSYSKDLVLKAGLMLSDIGSVGFKVENFNKTNMEILESKWEAIKDSLRLATNLLSSFGFNGQNLRADSAILPIAYFLHYKQHRNSYLSKSEFAEDRESLRLWLVKSLLKASGIWGSGLDTLLTGIRNVIQSSESTSFPVLEIESLMISKGKSLKFEEEEIEELADLEYGNKRTYALLSVLFSGFDFSHHFHVDHIYPKSLFNKSNLRKENLDEERIELFQKLVNQLPNLQLLEGTINNEKRQKMPAVWYSKLWSDDTARALHLERQAITFLPETLSEFDEFYKQRRELLISRIKQVLNQGSEN